MSSRHEILERVRQALGDPRPDTVGISRGYRRQGDAMPADLPDLFEERLVDYRAGVRRCAPGGVADTVAAALRERQATRVVVPAGLEAWLPTELEVVVDYGQLSTAELDAFDGVVTRAAVAIAETGTVVLDSSSGQGRRAITLIPDYHLCIVYTDQLVETVPEAVSMLRPERPLTWISGPSATSDIELSRVEGVHGPRTLEVVLVAA